MKAASSMETQTQVSHAPFAKEFLEDFWECHWHLK